MENKSINVTELMSQCANKELLDIIKGAIDARQNIIIYGERKTCKSNLVLDILSLLYRKNLEFSSRVFPCDEGYRTITSCGNLEIVDEITREQYANLDKHTTVYDFAVKRYIYVVLADTLQSTPNCLCEDALFIHLGYEDKNLIAKIFNKEELLKFNSSVSQIVE